MWGSSGYRCQSNNRLGIGVPIQQSRWTSRECTVAERPLRSTRVTRRTMMTLAPTANTLFIFLARFDKGAVRCASKCSHEESPHPRRFHVRSARKTCVGSDRGVSRQ